MASRGAFGFRSGKLSAKAESKEKVPVGSSSASNTYKMSTHSSSFFSRGKHNRAKVDPLRSNVATSPNTLPAKPQGSLHVATTRSEPGSRTMAEPARNTALGISSVPAPRSEKQAQNVLRPDTPEAKYLPYARTDSTASSYEQTNSENCQVPRR